jgi:hydroxyacylglutathione hydrolase
MKKPIKRILWGFSVLAGLIIVAALVFFIRFSKATRAMTPAETGAINDSVWSVRDKFVNAYIFKGLNSYLMIDAGFSRDNFAKELKKTGIAPGQITTILLTHTDGDHIGAMELFKNPAVYMQKDEKQMIDGTTGKTKFFRTKWKYGPYILLKNNDSLIIDGLKVKILHTPGHTPGSSCFIIGNDYLVTGDNLIMKDGKYEQFLDMFNMNSPEQIESLKLLPDPGSFKYILTGHHGVLIKYLQ